VRPAAAESGASIDWEAARRDLAARSSENPDGAFQVASGGEAPPVPVFLPSVPVVAQGGEAIFSGLFSFHALEADPTGGALGHQCAPPDAPPFRYVLTDASAGTVAAMRALRGPGRGGASAAAMALAASGGWQRYALAAACRCELAGARSPESTLGKLGAGAFASLEGLG
jgi:hypothetical protein